jgi:class 3 adenylate cyclase
MSQVVERSPLEGGREASSRHAWREALDLLVEADRQQELDADDLVRLAEAAWWSGRLDDSIAAKERAYAAYLKQDQPRTAAVIALALTQDYSGRNEQSISAGWFNRGERLLEAEPDCVEHGYLAWMATHGALNAGDYAAAHEAATRTLEIGMRFGDRDLQAYGLVGQGLIKVSTGEVKEGLKLLDEATVAAVSGECGPLASGIVYCIAIGATAKLGDYARAGQWTEAARRWCERQSISGFPGVCRVHRAEIMRLRGTWPEAEQEARRALVELRSFNLEFAAEGFYEIGEVRLRMGDLEAAEEAFREAHELGRDPYPGRALLWLVEGKVDSAAKSIRRALDAVTIDPLGRARLLPAQVRIAIVAGDMERARAAVDELERIADAYESTTLVATAHCAHGELLIAEGKPAEAIAHVRRSLKLWREADLPYEAALARMHLGVAMRADGDEDEAELELRAARSAFQRLGAVLDLRKVLELLGEDVVEGAPRTPLAGTSVTKTFMFTDIVGSTELAQVLGEHAWDNALGWHDDTLRRLFGRYCGEVVKHIGDGFFVAFDEPKEALECAVRIQREFAEHSKEHGFSAPIRIGLHTAEAVRKGADYGGYGVHVAARIGAESGRHEILASVEVVRAARPRYPISEPREVKLKGVKDPVSVVSIDAR